MNFQLKILVLAFVVSIIFGIIVIPILKKFKVGQIERDDGPESHLKKQGTPTMGGIIMALATVVCSVIMFFQTKGADSEAAKNILALVFVTLGFGFVGFIDDFKKLVLKSTEGLKPMFKMFGLLIIAVAYVVFLMKFGNIGTETYIPIVKQYISMPIWVYIPFAIFVMLGTTNAVNLTDGIDGLSSSVTTIILTCLVSISIVLGISEVTIVGTILIGACLGFLIFNLHPAKVFMGDTGSLMLGGAIAGIALYMKIPLILIVIALVPIIETLSVMIQVAHFKRTGKRVFKMAPIHHHFELSGWKEGKVVTIFSFVTLVLCIVGMKII